jgi:CRP-like cAMP-binding protein
MLFEDLTAEERQSIERISGIRTYHDGDMIIREFEPANAVYLILDGCVEVKKRIAEGRTKTLRRLCAQEFFGEMSFFDRGPRSADVVACGECRVLGLPMDRFDALVQESPRIGCKVFRRMAEEMAKRLRASNDELKQSILWAIEGWSCRV